MANETAMAALRFDLQVAADAGQPDEVREAALDGIMGKAFLSQIMILPTQGKDVAEETGRLFQAHVALIGRIRGAMTRIVKASDAGAGVKTRALELKNFFDVFVEAAQVIAERTREEVPPKKVPENGDGAVVGTPIRAPYLTWPRHRHPAEACCCIEVGPEGCGVLVKEFRGVMLVWRARIITEWIEPWYSRRRLIKKIVWVLEWVPVQFIKKISVDCRGEPQVEMRTVGDYALMNFWRGHEACGGGHGCGGGHHH